MKILQAFGVALAFVALGCAGDLDSSTYSSSTSAEPQRQDPSGQGKKEPRVSVPDPALLLAGFVLAHSAWSVSDLPKGELLVPLAVVERDGKRELIRFEADSQEAAIAEGKAAMARLGDSVEAWAFARDGLLREGGRPVDVITVDFWSKGMKAPGSIVQRYEPFANRGKFKIIGEPMVTVGGVEQQEEDSKQSVSVLLLGIQAHSEVKSLWPSWQ